MSEFTEAIEQRIQGLTPEDLHRLSDVLDQMDAVLRSYPRAMRGPTDPWHDPCGRPPLPRQ